MAYLTPEQVAELQNLIGSPVAPPSSASTSGGSSIWDWIAGTAGDVFDTVTDVGTGSLATGLGLAGLTQFLGGNDVEQRPVGYQGGIPNYTYNREQLPQPSGDRRPGSAGRRYFTDGAFTQDGTLQSGAAGLASQQTQPGPGAATQPGDPAPVQEQIFAEGGLASLAGEQKYLRGSTDGMADKVPATIDDAEPARLSDGEFVIPADVVSHLGNGNSEAGAKYLEQVLAKIRKERTGNPDQGKQIDPRKMLG